MKKIITTILLLQFCTYTFSQKNTYEYHGRSTPTIKKESLNQANSIYEIMPEFCRYFVLPFNEHVFAKQLELVYYSNGYFIQPEENYNQIINFVAIQITTTSKGKTLTSESSNDLLTMEQKNNLYAADWGSDISIEIKFKYKYRSNEKFDKGDKIKEGKYVVTVVPETEAEYPGGFKQFSKYLTENIFNKISEKDASDKIYQVIVNFSVNEEGQIIAAKIIRTSSDPKLDKLFLEAINKMPKWNPAKNLMGINVKQEFKISLGGGC